MKTKIPDNAKSLKISLPGERKPSKYRAVRTEYNGRLYDSKAEAKRAMELNIMKQSGRIAWWIPQIGIMVGEIGVDKPYRVDFLVAEWDSVFSPGCIVVHAEDVKGMETASFRRHVKQWRLRGPFPLHIITSKGVEIIEGGRK